MVLKSYVSRIILSRDHHPYNNEMDSEYISHLLHPVTQLEDRNASSDRAGANEPMHDSNLNLLYKKWRG